MSESSENSQGEQSSGPNQRWDAVPQSQNTKLDLVWEPLSPEQADAAPEDLIWNEPSILTDVITNEQQDSLTADEIEPTDDGLQWPNGQLMSEEDQAAQRRILAGNLIRIGTPRIGGFNAPQRHQLC